MTKKIEKLNSELQSDERAKLLEAANSSAWQDVIKPYLEKRMEDVRDVLLIPNFESDGKYEPGVVMVARRITASHLLGIINDIEAGKIEPKSAEDKAKDSFE